MRLGGFGRLTDYKKIKEAGFDFAELDIPEIEELSEEDFSAFVELVNKENFPILHGARALPIADPWFFTDKFDMDEYKNYLENACRRAHILGIEKIIIGNGKGRWLVDEHSLEQEDRFINFMKMFCEIAKKNEIEIILEPLGPKYSNYINTIPQAVEVIHKVGMTNLYTMADLRHVVWSKEDFGDINKYIEYIHHIHIDYPLSYPERPFPKKTDNYDYSEFFKALKKADYSGTLTIEADVPADWKAAYKDAMEVLKVSGVQ